MRILGIDPGTRITGFAVIEQAGRRLTVCHSGTIRLQQQPDLSQRLAELDRRLQDVIEQQRPMVVAVEDIFTHQNARSALVLGHARGVALAVAGRAELPVHAYAPATVKQAVAGHGRADKQQIQRMVQVLLALAVTPAADEADALAVAICHAMSRAVVRVVSPAATAVAATRSAPRRRGLRGLRRVDEGGGG
ncbi:MAG: crossover junction endodeoxyribonuclease RuvC [Proteobacteria bacterium]|nr:crossover junction endodeoxyribonuclease RuvC [Pseudomonadota bacterium]